MVGAISNIWCKIQVASYLFHKADSSKKVRVFAPVLSHIPFHCFFPTNIQVPNISGNMSPSQDIPIAQKVARSVSNSWQNATGFGPLSSSPTLNFATRQGGLSQSPTLARQNTIAKTLKPFDTKDVKVLLLENVNKTGQDIMREQGYQVEAFKASMKEDELIEKIKYVDLVLEDAYGLKRRVCDQRIRTNLKAEMSMLSVSAPKPSSQSVSSKPQRTS